MCPLSFVSPSKSELDSTPCEKNACALPLCLICILEIFRRGLNRARLQRDTNDKGGLTTTFYKASSSDSAPQMSVSPAAPIGSHRSAG